MIDLTLNKEVHKRAVDRARERNIVMPTFQQMIHPETVPETVKEKLRSVGLWDVNPLNLFRITWKNEPVEKGGQYAGVNVLELPSELTGVRARIVGLVGKWFPTGAHKVGASFACLAPRLISGQFDPSRHKAVWPSTGNYCRGGAYNSALLGCDSIAILPEEMSQERFTWLRNIAGEVIATPGCESNVKEIYDKCWELRKTRDDVVILNQFDEFGNYLWHFHVTGRAIEEAFGALTGGDERLAGIVSSTGSAGTIACGDYIKQKFPDAKLAAGEALQCPTLLQNGFGGHRIEGIGDKHVPWIHNVRNTDMVIAVDDNSCMQLTRLFNENVGREYLADRGLSEELIARLPLMGISSIGNLIGAIKMARYYEMTERDVIFTIFTDSMELYESRLGELESEHGNYVREQAASDFGRHLQGIATDSMLELTYPERKRVHNLKYFTWIEQQGRELKELNAQWYDPDYWVRIQEQVTQIDEMIDTFNQETQLAH